MKVAITIKHTETAIVNIGDLPVGMIRELLVAGDGHFGDSGWGVGDLSSDEWVTDSVTVEEVGK